MALDVQAINELADFIEKSPHGFDMRSVHEASSEAAGSVAGYALTLWGKAMGTYILYAPTEGGEAQKTWTWSDRKLAQKLGITQDQEYDIVAPVCDFKWANITRKGAITMLQRLAKTEKVEWFEKEQV